MTTAGQNRRRQERSQPSLGTVAEFQQVFEHCPRAIFLADAESGLLIDVNRAACELMDMPREEILGLHQSQLHPEEEAERYRAIFQEHVQKGEAITQDIYIERGSGELVPVDISASVVETYGGQRVVVGVFRDIAERKLAEEELTRRNEELAALNAIASTMAGSLNLEEVMLRALDKVLEVMKVGAGVITLSDPQTGEMTLVTHRGLSEEFVEHMRSHRQTVLRDLSDTIPGSEQAVVIQDLPQDSRASVFGGSFEKERLRSSAAVPLQSKGEVVGMLAVISREPHTFTSQDVALLSSIGSQIGMAVDNARLHEETSRRVQELSASEEIMRELSSTLDFDKVIQLVLDKAMATTDASAGSIDLVSEDRSRLIWLANRGYPPEVETQHPGFASLETGIIGRVARSGRLALVDDVREDPDYLDVIPQTRSQLTVPIMIENAVAGVIVLESPMRGGFTQDHADYVQHLAEHAAVAMSNARLYQRLRESEERYRAYVENVPDAIWECDPQGRYTYWSPQVERLTGYAPQELLGRTPYDFLVHPDEREDTRYRIRRMIEDSREEYILRHQALRKDGSVLQMEVSIRPMWDKRGTPISYGGVARDVSEQVRLQEQLVQSAKLSAIGQMISGVAHELNNPLTTVMGYAQLLLAGDFGERDKADLQRIYDDALRAQKIVQDLLTFARQKKPERSPTDVNEAVKRTLALRAYALHMGNIELVMELDEHLPWTMADGYQLQQVFLNIINNAYQAMTQLGRSGVLSVRTEFIGGRTIRVTISDTGPGIPPGELTRVFDPFFTTKDVGVGTGLGLSVSHGIIQEHGGRIWAESEPEKGAVFVVELPVIGWPEESAIPPADEGAE